MLASAKKVLLLHQNLNAFMPQSTNSKHNPSINDVNVQAARNEALLPTMINVNATRNPKQVNDTQNATLPKAKRIQNVRLPKRQIL